MPTSNSSNSVRWIQFIGRSIFIVCLLVSALAWLWPSAQDATAPHQQSDAATNDQLVSLAHAQRAQQQSPVADHSTKAIEQIRVGERVLARNPEVSNEERASWTEPDWSGWLQLSLVMPKEDGSELQIELLRSEDWVRSQINFIVDVQNDLSTEISPPQAPTIDIGQTELSVPLSPLRPIFRDLAMIDFVIADSGLEVVGLAAEMDLPELAITGPALLVDLQPAPQVQAGAGRVVTATFHHTSGDVIDLTIGENVSTETIGTTGNHPFWSEDRQEYVQAATLEIGEQVRTYAGDTKQVVALLPRPGPEPVFNLEVHGEHVYYVGDGGVLIHNAYVDDALIHSNGFFGHHSNKLGILSKRVTRDSLAGDHVLPKEAIKRALARAGVKKGDKLYDQVIAFQDSSKNLRLMDRGLNSSKGQRNAVEWMATKQGSKQSRKFIRNILRKQYKNAQEINKILNNSDDLKIDFFEDFFRR
ncbi:HINT domain-containing protein [Stieleria sp. JC731]|uniref:polymorphic toxin-type HINT domain-containing protein n=1 Tax=Pirellulaceae TaxID=2691357 RepID=UPI001E346F3A|nr:polymorphic toxin-type HINT domain-containing protein [Stieleria sp. JC731]MCC9603192.1 HINT domain-containing protein [Stieleria sp. JC731]